MTNSDSSFIVSSLYDILKPDGVNVIELGNGKYQLMRPAALSNLHNIAFRSFTGELLPFTSIDLPKLKAELIMMSNGLKSVTLSGQDTMDLPAVNTYDNTKQNVILSIDKAWTYNADADSQVIYNIQEIVELMNERLKDYFVYTSITNNYSSASHFQVFYDASVRVFPNKYMSAIVQDIETNAFKAWQVDDSASTPTAKLVPFGQAIVPTNCKICFVDPASNAGLWVQYNDNGSSQRACITSYDSASDTYRAIITIPGFTVNTKPEGDPYLKGGRMPPGICVSLPSEGSPGYTSFVYIRSVKSVNTPQLLVNACIDNILPLGKTIRLNNAMNWPSLGSYYAIYPFGFDTSTNDIYIAITYDENPEPESRITYAKVRLDGFDVYKPTDTSAAITVEESYMQYTQLGDGDFATWDDNMYLAANTNLCDISIKNNYEYRQLSIANQFWIEYDGTTVYDCRGFSRNFFKLREGEGTPEDPNPTLCIEYDPSTRHYHLCDEFDPRIQRFKSIEVSKGEYVVEYPGSTGVYDIDYDIGTDFNRVSIIPFKTTYDQSAKHAFYVYDANTAATDPYFNYKRESNGKDIATINNTDIECTATDKNNNTLALNPANSGKLCSNVDDFIKLDDIWVKDGVMSGAISIPQIEFEQNKILNFNLKIHSEPYYFNLYTYRDFTQQGHAYNLDINHTLLYYRASNRHVLDTLEYLILLKYNYNYVKLRVNGFPNNDGLVFNMNENSYVSFKNMPTDNTMNSLIVEIVGDDDEALPSEILRQLFGKVSLAIEWMQ